MQTSSSDDFTHSYEGENSGSKGCNGLLELPMQPYSSLEEKNKKGT